MKTLVALPVYNEVTHVRVVLDQVRQYAAEILVVDDGSTDGTSEVLSYQSGIRVVRHDVNRGYGAALKTAFASAIEHGFEALVTIDCDGQHEPQRIPELVAALHDCDIVSGSRYLELFQDNSAPPEDRWAINRTITAELNQRLGLALTDTFCGFKAYRTSALRKLTVRDNGYAMPLDLWVQAACAGLRIRELPVPLIYLDEKRSFGGALDNATARLAHYRAVIEASWQRAQATGCFA